MKESWTDDRLDDLNGKVDALHLETRTEFRAVRGEMKGEFSAVRAEMKEEFTAVRHEMKDEFSAVRGAMRAGFDRVDHRFDLMEERFDGLQRTLLQMAGATIATLLAGLAGIIATQL